MNSDNPLSPHHQVVLCWGGDMSSRPRSPPPSWAGGEAPTETQMFTGPSLQRGIKGGSIPPGPASLQSTSPNEPPPQDLPYSHRTTQAVPELGAWLVQGRQDH